MKRMLINATQPEELRVAIADGQILVDLDIEVPSQEQKKSNVYKGRITRIEPSLEACFVDFGSSRHGFLPFKEICPESYANPPKKKEGRPSIKDVMKEGQELIIQVEKEERGNKGAALTTYISLAGRYLVLMPTNPKAGGVSRRISGEDRSDLREQLQQVIAPDNVGIIVRTAGVGREADELQWDLDYLLQLWTAIEKAATENSSPFLIYQESNLFIRALRDHLRNDIGEILIDNDEVFENAREFMQQVMPHNLRKLKQYKDPVPLFNRYQIESQIESAFARTVHLPSGGSLVIDHTEAMLAIDINSARSTKGADIEETAYRTNLEAADEVARQLRLRDLGGLIVIDFIDMMDRKHQRNVEERLRHALQIDKARVQTGRISRFGLLEMSRQRLRPSLGESSQETCPRCDGHGTIRSVESLALSILRLVEEESMKEFTGQVIVQAPVTVGNFLLNEKRPALADIERRHNAPILVVSNEYMERPKFEIHRVRKSEVSDDPSFTRVEKPTSELVANAETQASSAGAAPVAAVTRVAPSRPAPSREPEKAEKPEKKEKKGFFGQLFSRLFDGGEEEEAEHKPAVSKTAPAQRGSSSQQRQGSQPQKRSPDSRSRKRSTKKKQSQQQAGQRQADGQRGSKKTSRKKASKKKANSRRKPVPRQDQAKQDAPGTQASTENSQPENAGGQRKPRRRRSPYQTAGAKSRDNRTEEKSMAAETPATDNVPPATKAAQQPPRADSKALVEKQQQPLAAVPETRKDGQAVKPADSKPADKPADSKPADRPANSKPADTPVEKTPLQQDRPSENAVSPGTADSKKPAPEKPRAENSLPAKTEEADRPKSGQPKSDKAKAAAGEAGGPVKRKKAPKRKKAAARKRSKKTEAKPEGSKESAAPQAELAFTPPAPPKPAKPAVEVTRDAKGIYTLKPAGGTQAEAASKPAEKPGKDS
ncbi:MAG: Rne/Rng family ribonuclease [Xanthomonadales bacterium]|jgi:ribonuclease E|nr:Rne/Rng family ribonuclease [Xanthomonadales bacterium]